MLFKTLNLYLLRQFFSILILATTTLACLFLVFDLLAQSDKILAGGVPAWRAIPLYSLLRLPQIISLVLPIGAMLAAIGAYLKLHNHHEATAITSAGIRLVRVVWVFFSGALLLAGAHFLFINSVATQTSVQLRLWQESNFSPEPPLLSTEAYPTWFDAGTHIAYAESATNNGHILYNVRLIKRNALGVMETYITSPEMVYKNGTTWHLKTPEIRNKKSEISHKEALLIKLAVTPDTLTTSNKKIEEMGLHEMWALRQADQLTNKGDFYYETWFWRRFSQPFSTLIMVLVATPLLFVKPRQENKASLVFSLLLIGFLFFIGERITLAIGEAGDTHPLIAIWGLPILFLLIFFSYLWWKESPKNKSKS